MCGFVRFGRVRIYRLASRPGSVALHPSVMGIRLSLGRAAMVVDGGDFLPHSVKPRLRCAGATSP